MVDLNTLVLAVAAILFVIALGSLTMWAFRTFFGRSGAHGFTRPREKRLAVQFAPQADRAQLIARRERLVGEVASDLVR